MRLASRFQLITWLLQKMSNLRHETKWAKPIRVGRAFSFFNFYGLCLNIRDPLGWSNEFNHIWESFCDNVSSEKLLTSHNPKWQMDRNKNLALPKLLNRKWVVKGSVSKMFSIPTNKSMCQKLYCNIKTKY